MIVVCTGTVVKEEFADEYAVKIEVMINGV